MTDGQECFDQPVISDMRTYDNIRNITTGQGDDYTRGCLLYYTYFKQYYQIIARDLTMKQVLDADQKAMQPMNLTGNLERDQQTTIFFIIEEAKETILDFLQGTVSLL